MFRKVLIANRGEIACRIIRTARRMGVASVAVFSDADADALHVEMADEAWRLGAAPARDSYLSIERIIDAARRSGADAIHPGYGFLSESPAFSESCAQAGIVFIGPSAKTMRAVGDKAAAKRLMNEIGAPTLPGFHGDGQDARLFASVAREIGYPVVVKASAGGGGRGMRVVCGEDELARAMESAAREATLAFGDGRLLLEKYVERPRHVEIQFVADALGNVVTFAERDCSLQRRHQKVMEESPGAGIAPKTRAELQETTTRIARACGYVGAGTAEFLLDGGGAFYFLEVNARLQVEHPVTEMIAGVDLVEWQLLAASGNSLPKRQEEVDFRGWAMEARLCAEDPTQGFRPSSGSIAHLRLPFESDRLRVDIGVKEGDAISSHYDSLIAKIVVWDEERDGAVRLLARALDAIELVGVATNLDFLRALLRNDAFLAGRADTGVAQDVADSLSATPGDETLLLAAAATSWRARESASQACGDPFSPWAVADAWRLYGEAAQKIAFRHDGRPLECEMFPIDADSFRMTAAQGTFAVTAKQAGDRLAIFIDGRRKEVGVTYSPSGWVVIVDGRNYFLEWVETLAPPSKPVAQERPFTAPLPARVVKILVKGGERIEKGAALILLEAMKMEIPIKAPHAGVVKEVFCAEGQSVREGEELLAWRSSDVAS